jgi:hypothetical protein
VVETCDGVSNPCPSDAKKPSTTVCRSSAGVCDVADNCTGTTDVCPTDVFKPSSTVCRSAAGDCDAVENCTGSAASCPADLPLPDTDSDGFCDVIDDCPQVADPGQVDTDNDGEGDACDICTNTLPSYAERQKVLISKVAAPGGDDKLKIQGRCVPFVDDPLIDPLNNGIRVKMGDATGGVPLDVTLPPGAYDPVNRAGWKVHNFPTGLTALYKNAGTVIPLIQGIKTMKFVAKTGTGISKFKVIGKNGSYPIPNPAGLPVKVTLVAAPPISMNGQCCEMYFPGPAPDQPSCAFTGGGVNLKCK